MIFVGDIALPYTGAIQLTMPSNLKDKNWFGNLEGSLTIGTTELQKNPIVYNDINAIKDLLLDVNYSGFALANNHIFDTGSLERTIGELEKLDVKYCGIGKDLKEASEPLIINDNGTDLVILNLGWEVIQCQIAHKNRAGVNPLTIDHALTLLKSAQQNYIHAKIIFFMHWSYELDDYPQPFERDLAKELIDNGADGVIGSHPHRTGGFELYNGKPIVYSLGNWMFKQNYYMNERLCFPDFCKKELAFEWDFSKNIFLFHFFEYDSIHSSLSYVNTEDLVNLQSLDVFTDMKNKDYISSYKRNHYHKRKGLPIYYYNDSKLSIRLKNIANKFRDVLIYLLFVLRYINLKK